MTVGELIAELQALGLAPDLVVQIVTLASRYASRSDRDGRSKEAERARRYRANKSAKIVAARPADNAATVTTNVTTASRSESNCASKKGTSDSQSGNREVRKKETDGVIGRAKVSRGTRLTDDWAPTERDFNFARDHGLTVPQIETEATKFRNYWMNRTDRQASKPQWWRAWQNWILNRTGGRNGAGVAKPSLTELAFELAGEARELEREAGIGVTSDPFRSD